MTLFDDDDSARARLVGPDPSTSPHPDGLVVRVVPDVPAMDRELDYAVPDALAPRVQVGSVVRVPLHGRRVRGWVTEVDTDPPEGVQLAEVARVSGLGPDRDVIELCRWAAWRWVGRLPNLLRIATPDRNVPAPSRRSPSRADPAGALPDAVDLLRRGPGVQVLTVSPATDPVGIALAAASLGQALVVGPLVRPMDATASALQRSGAPVARWPHGFAGALAGHSVVGGRSAVFAPLPQLAAVVVWDEHDEGLQHESSPTWHARDVAIERARRAGVPCLLVSPCPTLEARRAATTQVASLPAGPRRSGWARLDVVDRRRDDPRTGLYSEQLVAAARRARGAGSRVVCVLNRTGRARLLACRSCGTVAECERCAAAVQSREGTDLECGRCGMVRPTICLACGGTAMKVLRPGITRAREDLEALLREPVEVVSAAGAATGGGSAARSGGDAAGVLIGTEAVLHRVERAGLVAFLDMDQELLATRYRAADEALALLVTSSRLVGGRRDGASVLVQTRRPAHPVLQAALRGDPGPLAVAEEARRGLLALPPAASVAAVGGEAAETWIDRLGRPDGVEVQGPLDGWWLVRADGPDRLADACAAVVRPPGRLRLRVDPMRLPV